MTHFAPPILDTARLHLRLVALEDAEATSAMMTPAVSRWLASWPLPYTVAMARERIATAREQAASGQGLSLAITARGVLLGWIMLHRTREAPRTATLGYWLGEAHHRRGYLREAAGVVLPAAFDWLDLDRIQASAHPENAASFAVMQACGMTFRREEVIHAPARNRDEPVHVYAVDRDGLTPPSGTVRT